MAAAEAIGEVSNGAAGEPREMPGEVTSKTTGELGDVPSEETSKASDVPGVSYGTGGTVGLGVDIVEVARVRSILQRSPSFRMRVFTEEERAYCDATANPEVHYATRFAAREAVAKALGTGFSQGVSWRDIEVRRTTKGRPYAVLSGGAKRRATQLGVRELPISLSYTHTEAVACALAITDDSLRAGEARTDPMGELAARFKEARGMLDDIESASAPKYAEASGEKGEKGEKGEAASADRALLPACDGQVENAQG